MRISISKIVAWTLMILGFGCLGALVVLSQYFLYHRPVVPNQSLGFTYAFQQHGAVVYLTHCESVSMNALFWLFIGLTLSAVSIRVNSKWGSKQRGR